MKEKIYNECLRRMEQLKLSRNCINAFKKNKIWESEWIGALYEINEGERKIVEQFEKEHEGYKVYHMIHNKFEFGEVYSILYVGIEEYEWEFFDKDLKNGTTFVYCYNKDFEEYSEFGSIGIKSNIGGLVRTY